MPQADGGREEGSCYRLPIRIFRLIVAARRACNDFDSISHSACAWVNLITIVSRFTMGVDTKQQKPHVKHQRQAENEWVGRYHYC
jgi:hypothetical protein